MLRAFSNYKPKRTDVNFVLLDGGVGDHIGGSIIAINYVIRNYKWITPHVWVPDFFVEFATLTLPPGTIIRPMSLMKSKFKPEFFTRTTKWIPGDISPMKIHTVDYAFLKLCDERVDYANKNYLRIDVSRITDGDYKLPSSCVVFGVGFTARVREFPSSTVNEVARYCVDKGYTPIFLGQSSTPTGAKHIIKMNMSEEVDLTLGLNLINKTSLTQALKVIDHAKAFVGVDCGLMHLAGCTDTPIVGGYTTVSPEIRMPIRRNELGWNVYPVTPDQDLVCKFCQERTNFLFDHDYKWCIYDDYQCVSQMRPEKFIAHLEKIL